MIEHKEGNLFVADVEALVNTVNCVGVMGKGIALQFKQAFPENFREYSAACRAGKVQIGKMLTVEVNNLTNPKYIINFPTKRNWKGKSKLEDIQAGLADLLDEVLRLHITSIAVPPLGCGNGGLEWTTVRPLIEQTFAKVPHVQVLLYEPQGAPETDQIKIATSRPRMTLARALLIRLIDHYRMAEDYRLSLLEVQKLAYLLQEAGEPLKLQFTRHQYGPYAENLNFILQRMDGHFIRGYGDRTKHAEIYAHPQAVIEASEYLAQYPLTVERLGRVAQLIEGFETPHGMELLATVHWVVQEHPDDALNVERIIEFVFSWNEHKRTYFKREHIVIAWRRLKEEGWLPTKGDIGFVNITA
jgi:O-acetyl-ADP-ribose deacetylase (regulator of RNase III)